MSLARTSFVVLIASLATLLGCASGGGEQTELDAGPRRDTGAEDGGEEDGGPSDGGGGEVDAPTCVDEDGDGFGANCAEPDCDDTNASISPAGTEACNAIDDDCDGSTDEELDAPVFCGTGACRTSVPTCQDGTSPTCVPLEPGTETCNGVDDDCNGSTDEGFGGTTCGIGECARTVAACSGGTPPECVPGPITPEVCNGLDDDCNTLVDDGLGNITCGRGLCFRSMPACTGGAPTVCVPGTPVAESCNNMDDNCDGVVDDGFGSLSCGVGACAATVAACASGVPGTCVPGTPTTETCNGADDDCDGAIDDGIAMQSCGVGACARTAPGCSGGSVPACVPGTPAASETCGNGIDDNCSGAIDEGCCTTPTNATCGTALPYTIGSTVSGSNDCSVADYTSTCGSGAPGNDVAYQFASDGQPWRYTVTMTGAAGYDTILSAMSASSCAATSSIACNDDFAGVSVSQITFDPPQGTVFLVADTYDASYSGSRSFTLSSSRVAVNNDTCSTPSIISANGVYNGTTVGKASNWASSPCQSNTSGADVVYQLTARATGTISINTIGSSFDTVLFVGTTCGSATTACDDDGGGGLRSSLTFTATAGTTYFIVVDGFSGASGAYVLNVSGY